MSQDNDFFIGWSKDNPAVDRRFFALSGVALLGLTGAGAAAMGFHQVGGGPGRWDQGAVFEWTGLITSTPYPMLLTRDQDGTIKTALLSCMNKCTPELMINKYADGPVTIRGSAIRRGERLMIATQDDGSWITPAPDADVSDLSWEAEEALGPVDLKGQIMDSKCWFGAMRPGEGKVHKACAALCIRSGLPPAFFVRSLRAQKQLLVMTDEQGAPLSQAILPYVADRLQLRGEVTRRGDLLMLKTAVDQFERL